MSWVESVIVGALHAFTFAYDVLTYPLFYFVCKPHAKLAESNKLKAKRLVEDDLHSPYRSLDVPSAKLIASVDSSCSTLGELFGEAARRHASRDCVGHREIFSEENEPQKDGKIFKKLVLGVYKWQTYGEFDQKANALGAGLKVSGQKPRENIAIFGETCWEWMLAAQASFKHQYPVVTIYATLGLDAVVHSINESGSSHVITSLTLLSKFKDILHRCPGVTNVVYYTGPTIKQPPVTDGIPGNVHVRAMEEVLETGSTALYLQTRDGVDVDEERARAAPEDVAIIMYTSGSTGVPKGVIISHANMMASIAGLSQRVPGLGISDTYVGYLPLAHVLELSAELSCLYFGTRIGYSTPLTLTDRSSKVKRGCAGDVTILQPTLMTAVPVIFERIAKTVWQNVNEGSVLSKTIFNFAYRYKKWHIENGLDTPIFNKIVFSKIRAILGGQVRLMVSGGAPLSPDTQRFLNICFCVPVGQGYGLTETCGAGTVPQATDLNTGHVGPPLVCCDVMLRDWEEGGYCSTDTPRPRGEVIIGGPNITLGYLNNPRQTAADYFTDKSGRRWFCSGDIGEVNTETGCLSIVDRRKDLVKLQAGEYLSPGKVESVLKTCPLVDNVCVCGDSSQMFAVALVVINMKELVKLADSVGKHMTDDLPLQLLVDMENEVLSVLRAHALKGGLEKFEIPAKVALLAEQWTPDTGLVTDAFKLRRNKIHEKYSRRIADMYS